MTRDMVLGAMAVALAAGSAAADDWIEAIHGDLSGDRFNPTPITLSLGSNLLVGSVGSADDDYFRYTVPAGWTLQSVFVDAYAPPGNTTFLGVNTGPIYDPTGNTLVLGWVSFGVPHVGTDVLPLMAASNGNFAPPLGPGTYSWWLDEGTTTQNYSLRFVVVPAPGAAAALALGLVVFSRRRSR